MNEEMSSCDAMYMKKIAIEHSVLAKIRNPEEMNS